MGKEYRIFIFIENDVRNKPVAPSFELLSSARQLAKQIQGMDTKVCALYLSDVAVPKEFEKQIFEGGADKIYSIIEPKLAQFNAKYYSEAIYQELSHFTPDIVLFSATKLGRELAPLVSTKFNTGLTADCTSLQIADNRLISTRPTFGGRLMAEIFCKTNPQMATLRPGSVLKLDYSYNSNGITEEFFPNLDNVFSSQKIIKVVQNTIATSNLGEADIVFAGGMGLKTQDNFDKLRKIVEKYNSSKVAFAASRRAVEAGFAPQCNQVGQTGITIAPKLYIAFGISGAIHHLIGIENAQTVVAVNNDPNAPIFSACDYKICSDANEVLEDILTSLR